MSSSNSLYFLMGVGVGVAATLLYAPKSGSETRDFLRRSSLKRAANECQMEYSRNLLFRSGSQMDQVFQAPILRVATIRPER